MLKDPPADWRPPAVALFVAGSPRSGSTLLCRAIGKTGLLGRPAEYFAEPKGPGAGQSAFADVEYRCAMAREKGTTDNGVMAAKIFWRHMEKVSATVPFDKWFPDQKWVLLRRRDLLGQAISMAIAHQTERWNAEQEAQSVPAFSRPVIAERLTWLSRQYRRWDGYFAEHRIEPRSLWYEDVESDLHQAVLQVADLVGGAPLAHLVRRSNPFVEGSFGVLSEKQRTALNEEWRKAYLAG